MDKLLDGKNSERIQIVNDWLSDTYHEKVENINIGVSDKFQSITVEEPEEIDRAGLRKSDSRIIVELVLNEKVSPEKMGEAVYENKWSRNYSLSKVKDLQENSGMPDQWLKLSSNRVIPNHFKFGIYGGSKTYPIIEDKLYLAYDDFAHPTQESEDIKEIFRKYLSKI